MASHPTAPISQLAAKRRIRHLKSLHIRNVTLPDAALSSTSLLSSKRPPARVNLYNLPDTFYELCLPESPHPVFFQSELMVASCNPNWNNVAEATISPWISPILPDGTATSQESEDQETKQPPAVQDQEAPPLPERPHSKPLIPRMLNSLDRFILKVWARLHDASEYHLIVETEVSLKHLDFVSNELTQVDANWPPNYILFGLEGVYFTIGDELAPRLVDQTHPDDDAPVVKVDGNKIRPSYKYDAIAKIVAAQQEIWELQCSNCSLVDEAQQLMASPTHDKAPLTRKYRDQKSRISLIEKEITSFTQDIQADRHRLKDLQNTILSRRRQLQDSQVSREAIRHALESRRDLLSGKKTDVSKSTLSISRRQRELITNLKDIFPIEQSTFDVLTYTICGLRLPNADYTGQDDEKIATALGFTAHLICMIAFYLEVPLRYSPRPMSSRATIIDGVSQQYQDNNEFPLFSRGSDRFRFDYGVFLLNKNVEQLMNHVGLNVSNLRNTLPNLKILCQTISNWRVEEEPRNDVGGLVSSSSSSTQGDSNNRIRSPTFKNGAWLPPPPILENGNANKIISVPIQATEGNHLDDFIPPLPPRSPPPFSSSVGALRQMMGGWDANKPLPDLVRPKKDYVAVTQTAL
ncbi:hypothetical protein SmJEL517_g04771 [Synchytrium microbalum]|uniref:Autophagy-related protein 14 n=1 Tax=Synchytrium microbalum TaxID=1806994 RepID=A0A507BQG0_9FUNG|nr:uncharacterized protein SmJEL517_g04771 [Synchytrium microbalum]TPX32040.1 hypothetical protein SmJEL517_g04771 [Synchytrium microbalum]